MGRKGHWMQQAADSTVRRVERDIEAGVLAADEPIVCASGISPSGPIHLGNLREILTTHLVAEALKERGLNAVHLHSWDDYDRFRKVPAGIPASYEEHIGKPLAAIPDPLGEYDSYASRYIAQFKEAMHQIGVDCQWVRQSEQYPTGRYRAHMRTAMERRHEIFDILARYQTEKLQTRSLEERRADYWPLAVYCAETGKDTTQVLDFDAASGEVTYHSDGVGERRFNLDTDEVLRAKLVWKVDWPMRWMVERVVFEPGGSDHGSPGSSYTVGKDLCPQIFGWRAPDFVKYAFVGTGGATKMSSSQGGVITPGHALRFIEPAILRWMYIRRTPRKEFSIQFGSEIWRTYDEFDRFRQRASAEDGKEQEQFEYRHCTRTSMKDIAVPEVPAPFRVIASAADMTNGNTQQILRIVADHLEDPPALDALAEGAQPRLDCALGWALHCLPEEERLVVRAEPCRSTWDGLDDEVQQAIVLLADGLADNWGLKPLNNLIYGVAKVVRGLPMDTKPDAELKVFQREVFKGIYALLLGADTGPRLPTLILSLGQERVRGLLQPA